MLLLHHLEVSVLGSLNLTINSVNFKLIGMDLTLVVLELSNHFLKLFGALLQVLLVNNELLSDFRATLLGQNVLQLNIELFFLLNENILLRNFFSFGDESLLEGLNLLNELVSFNISRLELSPSMDVERFAKLILQELSLLLLFKEFFL